MRVPAELPRFAELPMRVEYAAEDDKVGGRVGGWVGEWEGGCVSGRLGRCAVLPRPAAARPWGRTPEATPACLPLPACSQVEAKVLTFSEYDAGAGLTRWRLADVRANRGAGGKGRGLNRKQRDAVYELPLGALRRVNLHIDF